MAAARSSSSSDSWQAIVLASAVTLIVNSHGFIFSRQISLCSEGMSDNRVFANFVIYMLIKKWHSWSIKFLQRIFAVRRSTYKNKPNNIYRTNGFYVRREQEMIVENIVQFF